MQRYLSESGLNQPSVIGRNARYALRAGCLTRKSLSLPGGIAALTSYAVSLPVGRSDPTSGGCTLPVGKVFCRAESRASGSSSNKKHIKTGTRHTYERQTLCRSSVVRQTKRLSVVRVLVFCALFIPSYPFVVFVINVKFAQKHELRNGCPLPLGV